MSRINRSVRENDTVRYLRLFPPINSPDQPIQLFDLIVSPFVAPDDRQTIEFEAQFADDDSAEPIPQTSKH